MHSSRCDCFVGSVRAQVGLLRSMHPETSHLDKHKTSARGVPVCRMPSPPTALLMLEAIVPLQPGDVVVQNGATSAVGQVRHEWYSTSGAAVINHTHTHSGCALRACSQTHAVAGMLPAVSHHTKLGLGCVVFLLQHVIQLARAKGIKTVNVIRQRWAGVGVTTCGQSVMQMSAVLQTSAWA